MSYNYELIAQGLCQERAVQPNRDKVNVAGGSEAEVEVFTEAEVEKLLFYLENREQVSYRDRAVILLLLYGGLRVSELVNLQLKDLDLLTLNLNIIGKGGKYREIPLKAEAAAAIKDELEQERKTHPRADSPYLFLTQRAGRMDRDTVNKLLHSHGRQLALKVYPTSSGTPSAPGS